MCLKAVIYYDKSQISINHIEYLKYKKYINIRFYIYSKISTIQGLALLSHIGWDVEYGYLTNMYSN